MRNKILLQIFLSFIILLIIYFLYSNYFKSDDFINESNKENQEKIIDENQIKNIKYESTDKIGRKYTIKSRQGKINQKNPNMILLKMVTAEILLLDNTIIFINSDEAKYNNISNDTEFEKNVKLKHENQFLDSDNLNIFFNKNLLEAYGNLIYRNQDFTLKADKIEVSIDTKDFKIYNKSDKKIQIKTN